MKKSTKPYETYGTASRETYELWESGEEESKKRTEGLFLKIGL